MPEALATAAFRIAQESITNVLRHASAREVRVDVSLDAEGLTLTIADDGVGLPPASAQRPLSLGLLGMRERAAALGGQLTLSSPPAGGTRVEVRLPTSPPQGGALEESS